MLASPERTQVSIRKLYGRFVMLVLDYPILHFLTIAVTLVVLVIVNFFMDSQVWEVTYLCDQAPYGEQVTCRTYIQSRWELLLKIKGINSLVMVSCVAMAAGVAGYWWYWSRFGVLVRAHKDTVYAAKHKKATARLRILAPLVNFVWLLAAACFCVEAVAWSYIV